MAHKADPRRLASAPFEVQRAFLEAAVLADPAAKAVLEGAAAFGLPDAALIAGAVYKAVWNALTGRPPGFGVNDYDLAYCDPADLSRETEDAVIRRAAPVFAPLPRPVELCNQARVPLWFSETYGVVRAPIAATAEAVAQFACETHAVAIRPDLSLIAPYGLGALFSLTVAPFPGIADPEGWNAKCAAQATLWPEVEFRRAP